MTTASFHPSLMSTPHAGTFTAASGVHIHRGDALPAGHRDSLFICESAQNLVQRQIRSADGVTFTSRPAREGREFLASRDTWFRPVFAANGPDGALYIVDMYRKTIDHPQYIPEQSRPLLDFEAGKERGRIYRIVARSWNADRRLIDLGRMDARELSAALEHLNAWWRETAQRLLVERRDRGAVPAVRNVAEKGRTDTARIHALWTLDGLSGLEVADIIRALQDPHASVRENAVRLAEARVSASEDLLSHILPLADDPDVRVRFRAALALGETDDPRALDALGSIARRDGAQPWMRAAILSSVRERSNEFLRAFTASPPASDAVRAAVMQDLGQLFGAGQTPERCLDLIVQIADPNTGFGWQPAALAGIAQGLQARGLGGKSRSAFMTVLSSDSPQAGLARQRVDSVLARASALALDETSPVDQRLTAIELMAHIDYSAVGNTLEALLAPRQPSDIQIAAVRALAPHAPSTRADTSARSGQAADSLLAPGRWVAFTPQVREEVLSVLLTDEDRTLALLEAIEKGAIAATALGPSRRNRLLSHRNAAIQQRARTLLASPDADDRMQVYERLRATVLTIKGRDDGGEQIFGGHCAACHTFDGAGGQLPPRLPPDRAENARQGPRLGPDLSGIRNQPADAILLHVLVPAYEITPGYEAYSVETRDGRTLIGRLESEAPNSLTLRDASAQHVILRSQIVAISTSGVSLMPNDFERRMSEQDLANLIAYLKSDRGTATRRPR
jgi:putative heme-binding domain-containing protein